MKTHPKKLHGLVSPDLFEPSPAQKLRADRCLANVQRLQSEFWQALRDLESALEDITGETVELESATDFANNDINSLIEQSKLEG